MELSIFLVFLGVALILLVLALFRSASLMGIVGFTFLFLLGLVILNNQLVVVSGENVTTTYTYDNGSLSQSNDVKAFLYSDADADELHLYGYLLSILGALGFVLMLFQMPQDLKGTYNEIKSGVKKL